MLPEASVRLLDQSLDSIGQSFHMSEIDYTFGVLIHPRRDSARSRARGIAEPIHEAWEDRPRSSERACNAAAR